MDIQYIYLYNTNKKTTCKEIFNTNKTVAQISTALLH